MPIDFDNLNEKVIPDPITGGEQTVYWNNENTFMMSIPHQCIPFPKGYLKPKIEWKDNEDGIKSWKIISS
jgi:hypothetical protein